MIKKPRISQHIRRTPNSRGRRAGQSTPRFNRRRLAPVVCPVRGRQPLGTGHSLRWAWWAQLLLAPSDGLYRLKANLLATGRGAVRDADPFARCLRCLLAEIASGIASPPRLAFLPHEAMVAVIQGGLSVTDRSLELRKIYAPRSGSRSRSRVRGRFTMPERRGSPAPSPTMEPLSLMAVLHWSYPVAFARV